MRIRATVPVCDTFAMNAVAIATIALYAWASWRIGSRALGSAESGQRDSKLTLLLALAAVLAHLSIHVATWVSQGGMDLTLFAALSLVGFGMAALSVAMAWARQLDALGSLVYPLAALSALGYVLHGPGSIGDLDWQLKSHAALALLAYATLAVSALLAMLLWLQDAALKDRRLNAPVLRLLPPLVELEKLLFRTITAGFLLLSAALLTGFLFVSDLMAQHLMHKTVLSMLSWAVFGALLLGRWRFGWRGRRAAQLTLGAMVLLLLAFFGSKTVLELILQRGVA